MSNVSRSIAGRQDRARAGRAVRQVNPRIRWIADEAVDVNAKLLARVGMGRRRAPGSADAGRRIAATNDAMAQLTCEGQSH